MACITLRRPEAKKLIEILDYIEGLDPDGSSRGLVAIYSGPADGPRIPQILPSLHRHLYEAVYPDVVE